MKAWLLRWWNDEAWFAAQLHASWRFAIALIGYLMQQQVIPTGIDGAGEKYGALLMILPFLVAAGNKTKNGNGSK